MNYNSKIIWQFIITITILAIFAQVVWFEFLPIDDLAYVWSNTRVTAGLSSENIIWAFTTKYFGNYSPLTWISLQLDAELYGVENPGGFHLTNLILHIISALTLFSLLTKLKVKHSLATVGTLLFALHPAVIEPVVWISSRKDVLATALGLLSINLYAGYALNNAKNGKLYLSCLAYLLSVLAKTSTIALPLILVLLDLTWFKRKIFSVQQLKEKSLFFLIMPLILLINIKAQRLDVNSIPLTEFSFVTAIKDASLNLLNYFKLSVLPIDLCPLYPHTQGSWPDLITLCILIFLILLPVTIYYGTALVGGIGWFALALLPYLEFFPAGHQDFANRWIYFALPGLISGLVLMISVSNRLLLICGTGLIFIAASGTFLELPNWKSSAKLLPVFEKRCPSPYAYRNIAASLINKNPEQAKNAIEKALMLDSLDYQALQLGSSLLSSAEIIRFGSPELADAVQGIDRLKFANILEIISGKPELRSAYSEKYQQNSFNLLIETLQKAADDNKTSIQANYNLARIYLENGDYKMALSYAQTSNKLAPDSASALNILAIALSKNNFQEQSLLAIERGLRIDPDHQGLWLSLAGYRRGEKNLRAADEALSNCLMINSLNSDCLFAKSKIKLQLGQKDLAEKYLRKAKGQK